MVERDENDANASGAGAAGSGDPGGSNLPKYPKRHRAAWGEPLFRIDVVWTRFETWLAVIVLGLEIFALSLWVILKGMSTGPGTTSMAGSILRALVGALVLGFIPYLALKKHPIRIRRWAAIGGMTVGILLSKAWLTFGVDYSANLLNWYQQASTLTLFGGLRGIGTRLTLLLALLGGSLATASGKHITIDFVTRLINDRWRLPVVLTGWFGAAVICATASWGFFDHIAIENFGARADQTAGEKVETVIDELGEQFFIARKQITLDMKSAPKIFSGKPYADWLHGAEWNRWLDEAGFVERYGAEAVEALRIPDDQTRSPMIAIPGRGEPRGELTNAANLVFPFGLIILALRFIMRSLLALSGHVSVDPEESGEFTTDQVEAAGR